MRGRVADGICGLSDRRNLLLSGLHALDLIVLGCILLWIILALLYMGKEKTTKKIVAAVVTAHPAADVKVGERIRKIKKRNNRLRIL